MTTEIETLRKEIAGLEARNEEELDNDAGYGGDHKESVTRRNHEILALSQKIATLQLERSAAEEELASLEGDLATIQENPLIIDGDHFESQEKRVRDQISECRKRIAQIGT